MPTWHLVGEPTEFQVARPANEDWTYFAYILIQGSLVSLVVSRAGEARVAAVPTRVMGKRALREAGLPPGQVRFMKAQPQGPFPHGYIEEKVAPGKEIA